MQSSIELIELRPLILTLTLTSVSAARPYKSSQASSLPIFIAPLSLLYNIYNTIIQWARQLLNPPEPLQTQRGASIPSSQPRLQLHLRPVQNHKLNNNNHHHHHRNNQPRRHTPTAQPTIQKNNPPALNLMVCTYILSQYPRSAL